MRHDYGTSTVDAAAAFERSRAPHFEPDRPTLAELAEDARLDEAERRIRQGREDAARARGEYVPSPAMAARVAVTGLVLVQRGVVGAQCHIAREGVVGYRHADVDALVAALTPEAAEVRVVDGVVWARFEEPYVADPFAVEVETEMPF